MKTEQLKLLGNVIEFPNNKNYENLKLKEQRELLHKLVDRLLNDGSDFEIIINKENALKTFDDYENKVKDYLVITTNENWRERLNNKKLANSKYAFCVLKNDNRL
ncbi:hypothetical protein [Romboutsia lituseburensis]|uniref:Uncharacterized protein n=1 Tax=Romboutsia lituseburensis DSM 797 TaxID=1121325 RepID=A0A1G9U1D3_9FIRM|nr:hypothetical protein [Romboutsia lituseburensis]CEH34738.1 Hypothetical protein RLITU_2155 [Romboutsia lituseburensis]SDM53661.1 hypothetical protein SAMN04515677_11447 [Romboutsia lituseburensis DSM 797]